MTTALHLTPGLRIRSAGVGKLPVTLDDQARFMIVDGRRRELRGAWLTGVQTRPLTYVGEKNATTVSIRFSTSGFYSA